ncbi:unnamed protein product [Symbiodinium natans]|uniref:Uncharacterized protein n=1 Tax=Symbiodinium natans TaxID=878477 RepID=A0A812T1N4_9DINO|nr:unnamed protein product [Symbiodinium natans]
MHGVVALPVQSRSLGFELILALFQPKFNHSFQFVNAPQPRDLSAHLWDVTEVSTSYCQPRLLLTNYADNQPLCRSRSLSLSCSKGSGTEVVPRARGCLP